MFRQPKGSTPSPAKKGIGLDAGAKPLVKNKGICKYKYRPCYTFCLENYDYCLKHILEDRNAPYKPCPFLFTVSGKKCGKPAYRPDRRETWFCAEHSRRANTLRQKASVRHKPPPTQEALLASLAHYTRSGPSGAKTEANEEVTSKLQNSPVNPFLELDASKVNSARCSQVLDYASESDSDVEPAMLDNIWRAQDHESSDAESIDSQAEDPLKYAGAYTAEEVTVVIKDKMIRLQSLYIDQFRRLQHLLKEKRRKYLHSLKKEKETLSSIHAQEKSTAKDQKLYEKLKALNHYHKYYGEEAILHKKSLERRSQMTDGTLARGSHKGKCAFTEGGVKCGAKTLPVTKYCRKHILEDPQQVLFRACGVTRGDHTCQEPTANVFEDATCVYHIPQPALPHITLDMPEMKMEGAFDTNKVNTDIAMMDVDTVELTSQDLGLSNRTNIDLLGSSKQSSSLLSTLAQGLDDFPADLPMSTHSSAEETISADETVPNSGAEDQVSDVESQISSKQFGPPSENVHEETQETIVNSNLELEKSTKEEKTLDEDKMISESSSQVVEVVDIESTSVVEEVLSCEAEMEVISETSVSDEKKVLLENINVSEVKMEVHESVTNSEIKTETLEQVLDSEVKEENINIISKTDTMSSAQEINAESDIS